MDKLIEEANEILDISQKIFQIQEKANPTEIFGNKIFRIGTEKIENQFLWK